MNMMQRMMFEALCNDMSVALFTDEEVIRRNVVESDSDTIRAFFDDYTKDEIIDLIEQISDEM